MYKRNLLLLVFNLIAVVLVAQTDDGVRVNDSTFYSKPIITLRSTVPVGDSIVFIISVHKPTTIYLCNTGVCSIEYTQANEYKVIKMQLKDSIVNIYGDGAAIQGLWGREYRDSYLLLDSINIDACTELTLLDIEGNPKLKEINLLHNTKLQKLRVVQSGLEKIEIEHLTQLQTLRLWSNKIEEINFPENTLTEVTLSDNKLQHIETDRLSPNLRELGVSGNQLTELNLYRFSKLKAIYCDRNELTTLILPAMLDSLTILRAKGNKLSSLDLLSAQKLYTLDLGNNKLTHLTLPNPSKLSSLYIQNNQLEGDLVLPYESLEWLNCNNNMFTSIDASQATKLKSLYFEGNKLKKNKRPMIAPTVSWNDIYNDYEYAQEKQKQLREDKKAEHRRNSKYYQFMDKSFPDFQMSFAVDAGYILMGSKYGTNQGYIGGVLGFSNDEKRPYHGRPIHQLWLGAGINYGRYNSHKTESIPTFSLTYSPNFLYTRVSLSKYHVLPVVGINMINLFQLHLGYSYGYHRKNGIRLSGPTLGINLTFGVNHMFDLSN